MNARVLRFLNVMFIAVLIGVGGGRAVFLTVVQQDSGSLSIENRIGRSIAMPLSQPNILLAKGIVGSQMFSKQDLLFFVRYDYLLRVAPPYLDRLDDVGEFRVALPGTIVRSNADVHTRLFQTDASFERLRDTFRVGTSDGEIGWTHIPADGTLFVSTRAVRWWLVVFTATVVLANGLLRLRKQH